MTDYIQINVKKRDFTIRTEVRLSEDEFTRINQGDTYITRTGDSYIARNENAYVAHNMNAVHAMVIPARKRNFRILAKVNHG